ncbi:MAG: hypothetical protein K2O95_06910 [Clostridia bacterium]|nr:hypothetical protein [Clostridia bacterium]
MIELSEGNLYNRLQNYADKDTEEIYKCYTKNAKGYFLDTFLGLMFWKCALMAAICGIFCLVAYFIKADHDLYNYFIYFFFALIALIYLIDVLIKLWFWKYSKHVIVTNQGIWIMVFSTFWWSKNHKGKKKMFSAHWSFYDWGELKGVFVDENWISKICKLKNFAMDRWDGEEVVRFLKSEEVDEIIELSIKHINPRKRKKERDPKPPRFGRRKTDYYT